ncbi:hypothetical protein YC2023_014731 [Brassica napus]
MRMITCIKRKLRSRLVHGPAYSNLPAFSPHQLTIFFHPRSSLADNRPPKNLPSFHLHLQRHLT